jgi:hypothetical protein
MLTMKITIITLLCGLAACTGYVFLTNTPVEQPVAQPGPGHSEVSQSPTAVKPHAPQAGIASGRAETVLGVQVREDRRCTVELRDYVTRDGVMFRAYSCTPSQPAAPHPYAHYGDDTLAAMAYADAEAAALLGRRLIGADTPRAFDLLIRAAALDGGSVEHIVWLSDQAFGTLEINGIPQVANMERQYELALLAARLGDAVQEPAFFRNQLVDFGVDTDRLNSLDAEVDALLQSMRDIQRTVLGEVTIGGQSDA